MESLWPKLDQLAVNVPVRILQEQVDSFNSQMNGMLSCTLEKENKQRVQYLHLEKYDYVASLYIKSPALPDYRLQLIEVRYSVAKAYPCEVFNCVEEHFSTIGKTANNADEFKNILRSIFNSQEVINSLQNILAQGM